MNMNIGGWSATGVLALIAITAGVALLVVYAARRGFVHRDLDGTIESADLPLAGPAPVVEPAAGQRVIGVAGATLLVVGLALGLASAVLGWGAAGNGPGGPGGCAGSWNGCPQVTPGVAASPTIAP
jgi:hypothetical protein